MRLMWPMRPIGPESLVALACRRLVNRVLWGLRLPVRWRRRLGVLVPWGLCMTDRLLAQSGMVQFSLVQRVALIGGRRVRGRLIRVRRRLRSPVLRDVAWRGGR